MGHAKCFRGRLLIICITLLGMPHQMRAYNREPVLNTAIIQCVVVCVLRVAEAANFVVSAFEFIDHEVQ